MVRALLLNDWKGRSAALPGHCPGGPVPAAAYVVEHLLLRNEGGHPSKDDRGQNRLSKQAEIALVDVSSHKVCL